MRRMVRLFLAISPLLLCACTVITVGESARIAAIRPGVVRIEPAPGAKLLSYRTHGLGMVPGRAGVTLGWAAEDVVLLYERSPCRIVLFDRPRDARGREFWKTLIENHPDICSGGDTP